MTNYGIGRSLVQGIVLGDVIDLLDRTCRWLAKIVCSSNMSIIVSFYMHKNNCPVNMIPMEQ